jgi:hypothetical protein
VLLLSVFPLSSFLLFAVEEDQGWVGKVINDVQLPPFIYFLSPSLYLLLIANHALSFSLFSSFINECIADIQKRTFTKWVNGMHERDSGVKWTIMWLGNNVRENCESCAVMFVWYDCVYKYITLNYTTTPQTNHITHHTSHITHHFTNHYDRDNNIKINTYLYFLILYIF